MNTFARHSTLCSWTGKTLLFCGVLVVSCCVTMRAQANVIYSGAINITGVAPDIQFLGVNDYIFQALVDNLVMVDQNGGLLPSVLTDGGGNVADLAFNTSIATANPNWTTATPVSMVNFNGGAPGYVGIHLDNGNNGWIQIQDIAGPNYRVTGWAYQDNGTAIRAGQTANDVAPAVPEPSTVTLMISAVAVGLFVYRRSRKDAPDAPAET